MNDILKQRLVGALILLALGVVFWPIIFVEPQERLAGGEGRIPPAPAVDTTRIPAPVPDALREAPAWAAGSDGETGESAEPDEVTLLPEDNTAAQAPEAPEAAAGAAEPATRSAAPERPALDASGVPIAWILQVASVSNEAKAEQLRDRLLALGEKAYVKKLKRGDKALYRVCIGPNFERAQLEKLQGDVDSRFGVKSMIVRYVP